VTNDPEFENSNPAERAERRLDSWKEIAQFLNRDVRTVQRWEKDEGLPIHRHMHQNRSSVFAFEDELANWLESESPSREAAGNGTHGAHLKKWVFGIAGVAVLVVGFFAVYPDPGVSSSQDSIVPFPQPVTGLPGHEVSPSLSPTGAQVAFTWNGSEGDNDDIYVQEISSGNPVRLTTNPAQEFSPAWSPRGDLIAFLRADKASGGAVVLINPVSRTERTLRELEVPSPDAGPQIAWTPDGTTLVVAGRWQNGAPFSLASIDPGTGVVTGLTEPSANLLGDFCPSFSPSGDRLAFVRNAGPRFGDVFLIDRSPESLNTGVFPRRVTRLRTEIRGIAWVPSGEQIIFSGGAWPRSTLWRVDPSGSKKAEPLVVAGTSAYDPVISPSRKLVFSRFHSRRSLWKIDLEGKKPAAPFLSPSASIGLPQYSRDQDRLVFTSDQSGFPELWHRDLKVGSTSRLTAFEAVHTGHASWSPNSHQVVFDSTVDGDTELFLIDVDAPSPLKLQDSVDSPFLTQLTNNSVEDTIPRWSRDGSWIYFSSNRSGEFEIWKLPASGGGAIQVTHGGGYAAIDSDDGQTLYFSKWNADGLWKMSLADGTEEPLIPGKYSDFTVAGDRLFLISESSEGGHRYELEAMNLRNGQLTHLFSDSARYGGSMAVSPGGEAVMLARYDEESADLMIVNGFHCRRLAGQGGDGICPDCAAEMSTFNQVMSRLKSWSW
jgi:Tol biopolymer transport system component